MVVYPGYRIRNCKGKKTGEDNRLNFLFFPSHFIAVASNKITGTGSTTMKHYIYQKISPQIHETCFKWFW